MAFIFKMVLFIYVPDTYEDVSYEIAKENAQKRLKEEQTNSENFVRAYGRHLRAVNAAYAYTQDDREEEWLGGKFADFCSVKYQCNEGKNVISRLHMAGNTAAAVSRTDSKPYVPGVVANTELPVADVMTS